MHNDVTRPLRVCLIEDAAHLREEILFGLQRLGLDVLGYGSAEEFYQAPQAMGSEVAVIDIGLPGENGFVLAGHLRQHGDTGIIMLTARSALDDRLRGLVDADFYFVKPVDLLELAAVIKNLGRRVQTRRESLTVTAPKSRRGAAATPGGDPLVWSLQHEDWTLVSPTGMELTLTLSERIFLRTLIGAKGAPVSREQLSRALDGDSASYDFHRIDTLVSRLRKKALEQGMNLPVRAVRGSGYAFFFPRQGDPADPA